MRVAVDEDGIVKGGASGNQRIHRGKSLRCRSPEFRRPKSDGFIDRYEFKQRTTGFPFGQEGGFAFFRLQTGPEFRGRYGTKADGGILVAKQARQFFRPRLPKKVDEKCGGIEKVGQPSAPLSATRAVIGFRPERKNLRPRPINSCACSWREAMRWARSVWSAPINQLSLTPGASFKDRTISAGSVTWFFPVTVVIIPENYP